MLFNDGATAADPGWEPSEDVQEATGVPPCLRRLPCSTSTPHGHRGLSGRWIPTCALVFPKCKGEQAAEKINDVAFLGDQSIESLTVLG